MEAIYTETSKCNKYRLRIEPDDMPYDPGDCFTKAGMPLHTQAEREQAEQDFFSKMEREGGPFGFIVEHKCPACGTWEHMDSCWGFDDLEYCKGEGQSSMGFIARGTRNEA